MVPYWYPLSLLGKYIEYPKEGGKVLIFSHGYYVNGGGLEIPS